MLKDMRIKHNLSQYLLSQLSGVSRYKISLVECGYAVYEYAEAEAIKSAIKLLSKKSISEKEVK